LRGENRAWKSVGDEPLSRYIVLALTSRPTSLGSNVENDTAINTILMINTMQRQVPPTAKCHVSGTNKNKSKQERKKKFSKKKKVNKSQHNTTHF
jgi:hypothetical protein